MSFGPTATWPSTRLACPSAGGSRRPAIGIFGACLTVSRVSFVATFSRYSPRNRQNIERQTISGVQRRRRPDR
jgi:hypothetical protein